MTIIITTKQQMVLHHEQLNPECRMLLWYQKKVLYICPLQVQLLITNVWSALTFLETFCSWYGCRNLTDFSCTLKNLSEGYWVNVKVMFGWSLWIIKSCLQWDYSGEVVSVLTSTGEKLGARFFSWKSSKQCVKLNEGMSWKQQRSHFKIKSNPAYPKNKLIWRKSEDTASTELLWNSPVQALYKVISDFLSISCLWAELKIKFRSGDRGSLWSSLKAFTCRSSSKFCVYDSAVVPLITSLVPSPDWNLAELTLFSIGKAIGETVVHSRRAALCNRKKETHSLMYLTLNKQPVVTQISGHTVKWLRSHSDVNTKWSPWPAPAWPHCCHMTGWWGTCFL